MSEETVDGVTYEEADAAYFAVIEKHASYLFKAHKRSNYPHTYRAMLSFIIKLNSLKNAMYDVIETNNPYAFNALFRCFLDHYLKFSYIFFRFLKENTDDVGTEYYEGCGAHEFREYLSAIRAARAVVGSEGEFEAKKAFEHIYPNAGTAKHLDETSAKFKYRAIIRYIAQAKDAGLPGDVSFLAAIIPRFAELSAFVHGGPHGDDEMTAYSTPAAILSCTKERDLVLAITITALLFTSAAIARELKEYQVIADEVAPVLYAWMAAP